MSPCFAPVLKPWPLLLLSLLSWPPTLWAPALPPPGPLPSVGLWAALDGFHAPSLAMVNRATTASLKFPHVLTIHPNGSPVSDADLLAALHSHPWWQSVTMVTPPWFIHPASWPPGPPLVPIAQLLGF
ncbi:hypothetical protein AX15_004386 [Amanita polypyramis BW_CC]|nr:hypothetical protein AX15_004386 [Amanita polypyramis BW_CC]